MPLTRKARRRRRAKLEAREGGDSLVKSARRAVGRGKRKVSSRVTGGGRGTIAKTSGGGYSKGGSETLSQASKRRNTGGSETLSQASKRRGVAKSLAGRKKNKKYNISMA